MTIKTTEIVSLTVPEWKLLTNTFRLLADIADSTETPIGDCAAEAAKAIFSIILDIKEVCDC